MQNSFHNISSCKCASTHNCLYYKSHPFRSGLPMMFVCIARDSGGIRTHDPQLRRLLLYPTELRNRPFNSLRCKNNINFSICTTLIDFCGHIRLTKPLADYFHSALQQLCIDLQTASSPPQKNYECKGE